MKTLFVGLLIAVSAAFVSAQVPQTALYYEGSPNGWLLQGKSETISTNDGWVVWGPSNYTWPTTNPVNNLGFTFWDAVSSTAWSLKVSVPDGQSFGVGEIYDGVKWTGANQEAPGISFFGDGRSEYQSYGSFIFLELEMNGALVESAAVDFYQIAPNHLGGPQWAVGSLRYNSEIPLATSIPEPSTCGAFAGISIFGFVLCARRKVRPTNSVSVG